MKKKTRLLITILTISTLFININLFVKTKSVLANSISNNSSLKEIDPDLKLHIDLLRATVFPIPEDNRDKIIETDKGNTIRTNLTYPSTFKNNTFDLYTPKNKLEGSPTILWIHGGAFIGGGKADPKIQNYLDTLASGGYTIVSMDYELAPEVSYPSQLVQVSELISYLKKSSNGTNMDNIFIAGDSAGGELAAQFSLIQTNPAYSTSLGIPAVLDKSNIKGNLLYCGFYDLNSTVNADPLGYELMWKYVGWALSGMQNWVDTPSIKSMTVKNFVTSEFPPSYITDGNIGSFTNQGEEFVDKLKELQVRTESFFCPEDQYGSQGHEFQFDLSTAAGQKALEDSNNFLENMRN